MRSWKSHIKKVMTFFVIGILMIIFCPLAKAATNTPEKLIVTEVESYNNLGTGASGINIRKAKYMNESGNYKYVYIYCIEGGRGNVYVNDELTLDKNNSYTTQDGEVNDLGVQYILSQNKLGSADGEMTEEDKKDYIITQVALWLYYYELNVKNIAEVSKERLSELAELVYNGTYDSKYKDIVDAANTLVDGALNARNNTSENPEISISDVNNNLKISSDNNYIESEVMTVTLKELQSYKANVTDSNFSIVDENGNEKTTFKNGDQIKIRISKDKVTSSINVSLNFTATGKSSVAYQYDAGDPVTCTESYYKPEAEGGYDGCNQTEDIGQLWYYKQRIVFALESTDIPVEKTVNFTYALTKTAIKISKQDATSGKELPGANLKLVDEQGNIIKEWVSKETPEIIELTPGKYSLTETIAPNGYVRSEETIEFTINEDGTTTSSEIVMKNKYIEVPATAMNSSQILFVTYTIFGVIGIALVYLANKKRIEN